MLTRLVACGSILGHTCGPGPVLPYARSIPVPDTRPTPPGCGATSHVCHTWTQHAGMSLFVPSKCRHQETTVFSLPCAPLTCLKVFTETLPSSEAFTTPLRGI